MWLKPRQRASAPVALETALPSEGDRLLRFFFAERPDPTAAMRPENEFDGGRRWFVEILSPVKLPDRPGYLQKGQCFDWHPSTASGRIAVEAYQAVDYRLNQWSVSGLVDAGSSVEAPIASVGFFWLELDPETKRPAFRVWRSGHREWIPRR